MGQKKKIVAITGARSEYDLMFSVFQKIQDSPKYDLEIIAVGPHLSENFGYTIQHIEADGFTVSDKIYNLVDSNQKIGRLVSLGYQLPLLAHSLDRIKPDLVLVAGDREEAITTTMSCAYMDIPVAHFFGGDIAKDGNIDNAVRYASSKFAHLHFVTLDEHKQTLIKLGEEENRISVIGNPALDRFLSTPEMTRDEVAIKLGVTLSSDEKYSVLIQHSIMSQAKEQTGIIRETLEAIKEIGTKCFINSPNSDPGNYDILEAYKEYETKYPEQFITFKNLDRTTYINLLRHANCLLGNSSSGILEAPSLGLGTINIGPRQLGRVHGENVRFVDNKQQHIVTAYNEMQNDNNFKATLKEKSNPYGNGDSADKFMQIIDNLDWSEWLTYKNITY